MAIPGESFTSSLRMHLIKNAIKPEWLLFGMSSEQLGDAMFKLGSCKALGVGGRRLQRRGFPELGTKPRARYQRESRSAFSMARVHCLGQKHSGKKASPCQSGSFGGPTNPQKGPVKDVRPQRELNHSMFGSMGGGPLMWGKTAGETRNQLAIKGVGLRVRDRMYSCRWSARVKASPGIAM